MLPRIVVAGGGPVGLTAALTLATSGIPVTVFEADRGVCDGSRAICISRRSLQLLERLGVAGPFLAKGLGWTEGTSYLGTTEIFHLRMPYTADDRFPPFINLQQYYAERFLAEACAATGLVEIRWGHRVTGVKAGPDGAELSVEPGGAVRADWLIAADGARSVVREKMGLTLEGRSFERRYLITDIELKCDWPTARKVWFDPVSNPGSTIIMHRQPDDVWRVDCQLADGEDEQDALKDENIRARIAAHLAMVGLPARWKLLWKTIYKAHTLSLAEYVHGRVMFAGDAAHLVPIFGVRGLNSGIDDAHNLGWKLALVAQGLAPPGFLATYDAERRAACLENIANATKSTWFMSPPSPGYVLARDAVLELAARHPAFRVLIDPRQAAAHTYRSAAIIGAPPAGLPLAEARIKDGRSLHDIAGTGFARIIFGHEGVDVAPRALGGLACQDVRIPAADPCAAAVGAKPGDVFLIRPDGYVAAVLKDAAEAEGALRRMGLSVKEERHVPAA